MQAMQSLNKKMDKQNGESNVEQNHHDYQNRVGALLSEEKKEKGQYLFIQCAFHKKQMLCCYAFRTWVTKVNYENQVRVQICPKISFEHNLLGVIPQLAPENFHWLRVLTLVPD